VEAIGAPIYGRVVGCKTSRDKGNGVPVPTIENRGTMRLSFAGKNEGDLPPNFLEVGSEFPELF
jgi:hypothetical protein